MMHDNLRNDGGGPLILFATSPSLDNLRVVNVYISSSQIKSTQTASSFQAQIIKCREFIFTEPDVIGSPSYESENCFHLITQISVWKTGRLHARFSKIGLEVSKPLQVTPAMYQACLRYTLLARIAPLWNKAGDWLVQGRDFLMQTGFMNAVKLEVNVNKTELYFSMEATAARFSPLKIIDLDITGIKVEDFLQNTTGEVPHSCIASDWCFVLPSMKKGRIIKISHDLPSDCPFRNYKELKRHWKNTYGYRLPESEDGMLFYQVNFRPLGDRLYSYPEVCLRAREMQKMSRVDPKPILRTFLQDLQNKLPSICGQPLRLVSKANKATLEVYQSNQTEQTVPNLTSRIQNYKTLYRGKEEMERLYSRTQVTSEISSVSRTSTSLPSTGYSTTQMEQNGLHCQNLASNNGIQSSSKVIMDKDSLFTPGGLSKLFRPDSVGTILHNKVSGVQYQRVPDQAMQNKPRIIPVFKPMKFAKYTPAVSNIGPGTSTGPRIVPVFRAKTVMIGAMQKLESTSNLVQRKSVFSGQRDDAKQKNSFVSSSEQKLVTKRKSTTKEARSNPSKLKKQRTKENAVVEE